MPSFCVPADDLQHPRAAIWQLFHQGQNQQQCVGAKRIWRAAYIQGSKHFRLCGTNHQSAYNWGRQVRLQSACAGPLLLLILFMLALHTQCALPFRAHSHLLRCQSHNIILCCGPDTCQFIAPLTAFAWYMVHTGTWWNVHRSV